MITPIIKESNQSDLNKKKERLLVVGGGGARGSWGAGFAHYLVEKVHFQPYSYVIGTSTGSLMAPFIVLNDFATLKKAYTSVTQSDIFDVNPFKSNGDINFLNAILRLMRGKKTFGESHNLRKLINVFLSETRYNDIINSSPEKQIVVCAINYKTGLVKQAKSGKNMSWNEMGNWIWASANEPLFMSFVEEPDLKDGSYVDGGVRQNVPVTLALDYAEDKNISDIDIIVNKPIDPIINKSFVPMGIFKNLQRLIELWETEVRDDNIIIAKLLSELHQTTPPGPAPETSIDVGPPFNLTFHFIPNLLYSEYLNELIFDETRMKNLWTEGEKGKQDTVPIKATITKQKARDYFNHIKIMGH